MSNTMNMNQSTTEHEGLIASPPRMNGRKFTSASTPDYCPFSVEVEPSSSLSFENLRLSTVSKSWSLAMRTTSSSNLIDKDDSEDKDELDADDEFPLNQMDEDIERALSNEKAPVGLVRISSDSESSSRDESIDIDSEDEMGGATFSVRGAGASHLHERNLQCALSPRLSRTPGEMQRNPQDQGALGEAAPPNPLNPLKILNPGVPQGHRLHNRHNSMSRTASTPQRGENNALVTSNSNAGATLAADCMCFAIEDVTQFFCPVTPRSTMIDNTTMCPQGTDCFPVYDYAMTSSPSGHVGSFPSIQDFWASPKRSPQPRSREEQLEALFLLNANLPRNRIHNQKRKHARKILAIWHGAEGFETDSFGSRDDFHLADKRELRRKRSSLTQPKCCYDSDPEQEVLGRSQRRTSLLSTKRAARSCKPVVDEDEPQNIQEDDRKQQQSGFRKFCPEPFTHLDTDEETTSDDDESSYETANCNPAPSHPAAPRNSDPKISFDFGKTLASVDVDDPIDASEGQATFEFGKADTSCSAGKGHRRELSSTTSLSTTGHSRFHTIRMSPEQISDSEASSDGVSSLSGSTALNSAHNGGNKQPQHLLPSYFQSYPTHWTEFQLLFSRNVDEDSVKSHVHELSNVRFPLVWHPGASSPSQTSGSPTGKATTASTSDIHCPTSVKIASLSNNTSEKPSVSTTPNSQTSTQFPISVHGAFEVGAHLEQMVVQPKFTWTPLVQPVRLSDDPDANHRELFLSGSSPPQVELLSIIRVNKAVQLDRNLYPYARTDRTCIVNTNDANHPTIVLEARSTQERDWLVFSLKLIVARLASIIITRDEDMLHEFFSPYSALMRLEEEEESSTILSECSDKPPSEGNQSQDNPNIECASAPTASRGKALIDGEEFGDVVLPKDTEDDEEIVNDESSAFPSNLVEDETMPEDDLLGVETEDEADVAYQDRDDQEIEDSIRRRNSGAYAILKRSLTATGPLVDYETPYQHEEHMPRTFSY